MVRFKARYLLFEILFEEEGVVIDSLSAGSIASAIRESIELHFGPHGSGLTTSMNVKYFSPLTNLGIVRIGRDHHRMLWAALTFMNSLKKLSCCIRVIHLGGTIKSTQKQAIEYNKRKIKELNDANKLRGMILFSGNLNDLTKGDQDL